MIQDITFESLIEFSELEKLKISWSVFDTMYYEKQV